MPEIYSALQSNAYSVALGPPRKVLADAEVATCCFKGEGYDVF